MSGLLQGSKLKDGPWKRTRLWSDVREFNFTRIGFELLWRHHPSGELSRQLDIWFCGWRNKCESRAHGQLLQPWT